MGPLLGIHDGADHRKRAFSRTRQMAKITYYYLTQRYAEAQKENAILIYGSDV